ncbi:MAG: AAA family ATPase [bacterium]|nr:AAA family ATPase [bacterium]
MWIEREITSELKQIARTFPVLVLVGPRQVGKTSLLEKIFPGYSYISLDLGTNAEAAETRPQDFLQRHTPPLVLDEIQYAPAFFRHIKTYVDAHRGQNGLFILTGSQNFMLMESVTDSLAGTCSRNSFSRTFRSRMESRASPQPKTFMARIPLERRFSGFMGRRGELAVS